MTQVGRKSSSWLAAGLLTAASGMALGLDRPPPAVPYGQAMPYAGPLMNRGMGGGDRNASTQIQDAADHIVNQQCTATTGGWGWPHDDCSATFNNITGPIATGLLRAYERTSDPAHLNSAILGGNYDLTYQYINGEARFATFTPAFLQDLSSVSGDPTYASWAASEFFDELAAGTYGPSDLNTAGWIAAVQAGRAGTWINLLPWEFHLLITTAQDLGQPGQDALFLQALLDGLNTLDNTDPFNVYTDVIGLAGGVRGLGLAQQLTFPAIVSPNHAPINGMTTLTQLADYLASLQNPDGSWYWHSNLPTPDVTDEDTQTTAYAVLALIAAQEAGAGDYTAQISLGRQWLLSMQDVDGGFLSYPTGDHNTEVEGEALAALSTSGSVTLNTADACINLDTDAGVLTVTIDMAEQPLEVVGGQFFLSYDTNFLDFVSAVPGNAPFTLEVFESVDETNGTIDYAVGVPFGSAGTTNASTMAVLTFNVVAETCTPLSDLVQFRTHFPPSRLTDDLGNPFDVPKVNLGPLAIDLTPPVITAPDDIWTYADAGTCSAVLNWVEPFDNPPLLSNSQMPGHWYVDRYAPAAFDSVYFDGDNRLHIGIDDADFQSSPLPNFYNTQGRKLDVDIPVGFKWSAKIYIGSDWLTTAKRSDIWATTFDSQNNISGYPILGFISNDPADDLNPFPASYTPRFRWFTQDTDQDPTNGYTAGWIDLGLPAGFSYDRWWTLEIELTPSSFIARVIDDGGSTVLTYTDVLTFGSIRAGNIIMQAYNFGVDYDVYWDDLLYGPTGPIATDNCSDLAITYERSDNAALTLNDPFPVGDTFVTWTATDECGNSSTAVQMVTVDGNSLLNVTVQLSPTIDGSAFDRCITFELTPTGGGSPVVVSDTLSFVGDTATAMVEVPCGSYACITARDAKHTLRKTDNDDFGIVGTNYVADFTNTGGDNDWLIGGNLNGDTYIDILDFGVFIGQFGTMPGADTSCGYVGNHADITADGEVGAGDFTFIQIHFLESDEPTCASPLVDGNAPHIAQAGGRIERRGPIARISVDDLGRMGLADLAVGDLNNDGWLDELDMAAFTSGARPDRAADVDRNDQVDIFDLLQVVNFMGQAAGSPVDINGDGWVTPDDLQFVIDRLGMTFSN
ncbi:MAG: hypothetical protein Kow0022_00940 [Phycisphaerales bacterium]